MVINKPSAQFKPQTDSRTHEDAYHISVKFMGHNFCGGLTSLVVVVVVEMASPNS